jgi:hypothetical protein
MTAAIKHVRTPNLEVAYEGSGDAASIPVVLLHAGRTIHGATTAWYRR